jgi:hypothetical protein
VHDATPPISWAIVEVVAEASVAANRLGSELGPGAAVTVVDAAQLAPREAGEQRIEPDPAVPSSVDRRRRRARDRDCHIT